MTNTTTKYFWGKPNQNYVEPGPAVSERSRNGTLKDVREDLSSSTQNESHDQSSGDAPEIPVEFTDLTQAGQSYVRRAVEAAVNYNSASQPHDMMPGSDGRVVCMADDGEIVGYGSVDHDEVLHSYEDEPSMVRPGGAMEWHRHGVLHRVGGPAFIYPDPETGEVVREYFQYGISIDPQYANHGEAIDPSDVSARAVLSNERERRERAGLNR